jgi:hypothetical protein
LSIRIGGTKTNRRNQANGLIRGGTKKQESRASSPVAQGNDVAAVIRHKALPRLALSRLQREKSPLALSLKAPG